MAPVRHLATGVNGVNKTLKVKGNKSRWEESPAEQLAWDGCSAWAMLAVTLSLPGW